MSVMAKIYNWMILSHIRPHIDPLLQTNQNGFSQRRSTVSVMLTLCCVIEEVKEHNLSAILTFVDFKETFGSINRDKMFNMLLAYGILSKIIDGIKGLYLDTMAQVVTEDGNTNFFPIIAGVQWSRTLVLYLFIIILDYIMRITMAKYDNFGITLHWQRGGHCPAVHLTDAHFADDTVLLSNAMNEAQVLVNAVESTTQSVRLMMNAGKWNSCALSKTARSRASRWLEGKNLECVTNFEYLSSWISRKSRDIASYKKTTWPALHKLDNIWKSNLPRWLRIQFFRAGAESILLYGAESWTLTKAHE